jgi:hypothetical protein
MLISVIQLFMYLIASFAINSIGNRVMLGKSEQNAYNVTLSQNKAKSITINCTCYTEQL